MGLGSEMKSFKFVEPRNKGRSYMVWISHLDREKGIVYVKSDGEKCETRDLEQALMQYVSEREPPKTVITLSPGTPVMFRHNNDMKRGLVLSLDPTPADSESKVILQAIDYGCNFHVDRSQVFEIPFLFLDKPFATPCRIVGMEPEEVGMLADSVLGTRWNAVFPYDCEQDILPYSVFLSVGIKDKNFKLARSEKSCEIPDLTRSETSSTANYLKIDSVTQSSQESPTDERQSDPAIEDVESNVPESKDVDQIKSVEKTTVERVPSSLKVDAAPFVPKSLQRALDVENTEAAEPVPIKMAQSPVVIAPCSEDETDVDVNTKDNESAKSKEGCDLHHQSGTGTPSSSLQTNISEISYECQLEKSKQEQRSQCGLDSNTSLKSTKKRNGSKKEEENVDFHECEIGVEDAMNVVLSIESGSFEESDAEELEGKIVRVKEWRIQSAESSLTSEAESLVPRLSKDEKNVVSESEPMIAQKGYAPSGAVGNVYVSYVESPFRIFLQTEEQKRLSDEMDKELNTRVLGQREKSKDEQFVAVWTNKGFRRGRYAREILRDGKFKIQLVDSGEMVRVKKNDIFQLPKDLQKCEPLCFPATFLKQNKTFDIPDKVLRDMMVALNRLLSSEKCFFCTKIMSHGEESLIRKLFDEANDMNIRQEYIDIVKKFKAKIY